MIFGTDESQVSSDPFAHARGTWAGLDWQPGTWWPVDGIG